MYVKNSFVWNGVKYTDILSELNSYDRLNVGVVGTAQMIRQYIKYKHPNVKPREGYSVTTSKFANGNSISVDIINIPITLYQKLNLELENSFEYGGSHYGNKKDPINTILESFNGSTLRSINISVGTKYLHVKRVEKNGENPKPEDWEDSPTKKALSVTRKPISGNQDPITTSQEKQYPIGTLIRECAGWQIGKKTLPDGRVVYNCRILPSTPPNKADWATIKSEIYLETSFKWGKFGAFEKWGVIASEADVIDKLCKILEKYYTNQGSQNVSAAVPPSTGSAAASPIDLIKVGDKFTNRYDPDRIYEITSIEIYNNDSNKDGIGYSIFDLITSTKYDTKDSRHFIKKNINYKSWQRVLPSTPPSSSLSPYDIELNVRDKFIKFYGNGNNDIIEILRIISQNNNRQDDIVTFSFLSSAAPNEIKRYELQNTIINLNYIRIDEQNQEIIETIEALKILADMGDVEAQETIVALEILL